MNMFWIEFVVFVILTVMIMLMIMLMNKILNTMIELLERIGCLLDGNGNVKGNRVE